MHNLRPTPLSFIRALVTTMIILATHVWAQPVVASEATTLSTRPNVLVIVTDDQRAFGTVNIMPNVRTRIRDWGVRYPNAYATTPFCCPSRASLLPGLYMHNHGVTGGREPVEVLMGIDSLSIVGALHQDGYRTGIFGKYLNNWPNDHDPANFDRWALAPFVTYGPSEWNVQGTTRIVENYPTSFVGARSLHFLDETEGDDAQPWFLYVAPMAPHMPATPQQRYVSAPVGSFVTNPAIEERDRSDKPPWVFLRDPVSRSKSSPRSAALSSGA